MDVIRANLYGAFKGVVRMGAAFSRTEPPDPGRQVSENSRLPPRWNISAQILLG